METKSMNWFLYDNGLRHERVNCNDSKIKQINSELKLIFKRIILRIYNYIYFVTELYISN